ncbi:hypothetical protein [Nocardia seriolae]|nr:hypothetical protein C6575_31205 [Nocardia seriolae]
MPSNGGSPVSENIAHATAASAGSADSSHISRFSRAAATGPYSNAEASAAIPPRVRPTGTA